MGEKSSAGRNHGAYGAVLPSSTRRPLASTPSPLSTSNAALWRDGRAARTPDPAESVEILTPMTGTKAAGGDY